NGEPDVLEIEVVALEALLHEQRAHLEGGGMPSQQIALQVGKREAAVDDVLDDQNVAVREVGVEVLDDAHDPARLGGRAVRGDGHEIELHVEVDAARQVG